jgi:alanine racemase
VEVEGVFSHYATADEAELSNAKAQSTKFDRFLELLQQRGVTPRLRHLDNSAGTMNFSHHYDMVRAGIVLYGIYPSDDVDPALLPLKPAMTWETAVSHVKTLEAGCPISYGGTFVTQKQTVVATIPVGYADGYRRSLSGKFYVLIRGQKAPILGRICMDQMMVDVTDIPDVQQSDRVILVGTSGSQSITMEQIAEAAGSFHYEFVCGISRRVPRAYYQGGEKVCTVHYLLDI